MPQLIVDGRPVEFTDEKNILDVVRKAGIELPTLCYQAHLTPFGACRMCVVDAGKRGIVTSCTTPPEDGLAVQTNSERVRRVRKMSLELMLAAHDRNCLTCDKSGFCKLQDYAERYGIDKVRFINPTDEDKKPIDDNNPSIVRDPNKCILCGNCVRVCLEHQGMHILDFSKRGSQVEVGPAFGKQLHDVDCIYCGQCATVCPVGAITVKQEVEAVTKALNDPQKTVVFQVAPAVRVGLGELFGMEPGTNVEGKIAAAIRRMGADKVFDTNFAADLTIMEEANEFLKRLQTGENLPIFTSCCPGWVKAAEQSYPELLPHLSSCRSPQQMFGSVVKKFFTQAEGKQASEVFSVSVMPCSAKKFEARRPEFQTDGVPDVDAVITTQELAKMIRAYGLDFKNLPNEAWDQPFGESSGAAVIFGASGGVAEAALRTAYKIVTGTELELDMWQTAKAGETTREAVVDVAGTPIRIATVNSLVAAAELIEKVKRGGQPYHLVEVMACPGGCVGGAGQPPHDTLVRRAERAKGLASIDSGCKHRQSHLNQAVQELYTRHLQEPNSHEAHEALHTEYSSRRRIEESITLSAGGNVTVEVCVGTCCFQQGAYETMQKLGKLLRANELEGAVELKATFCFEKCGQGPNISVNGKLVENATPERAEEIFRDEIIPSFTGESSCSGCAGCSK
ncbi:MAG TPA: [FeFe] hydrogenase, group A [Armatimonadota bacterium]|jgi:NADH-quinone oxidoreductase subunit G